MSARTRLSADERRSLILGAAEKLLLSQGYLPLPVDDLASNVGSSKALIYTYFPTQHDLFNTVARRRLEDLWGPVQRVRARLQGLKPRLCAEADIYMEQVANCGPVVQFILRDSFMARNIAPGVHRLRMGLTQPLVNRLRRDLRMTPREAVAAAHLLATIPEEAGAQVHRRQITLEQGRELCHDLVSAGLEGLRGSKG